MKQYLAARRGLPPDTLLFFRLGDFYEMFYEDANEASRLLDITLTKRQSIPMCGVPVHTADVYLAKLVRAGKKVAICDQVEEPAGGGKLIRREISRVVTPGTIIESLALDSNEHNYLVGVTRTGNATKSAMGLALLDLSTGLFWLEENGSERAVLDHLMRYQPTECLIPEAHREDPEFRAALSRCPGTVVTFQEDWTFDYDFAHDLLINHFGVLSLEGFGCREKSSGVGAAGAVLHYVSQVLKRRTDHVRRLQVVNPVDFMVLDEATTHNLDLVPAKNYIGGGVDVSLLKALDSTKTAMGGRMLRDWLVRPLTDLAAINRRHDGVEAFVNDWLMMQDLREKLSEIKDLERLIARLSAAGGNARDLRALATSLSALPRIKEIIGGKQLATLRSLGESIVILPELIEQIERAIVEEPPVPIKEGGIIRQGFNAELDELRSAAADGKQWLADFQAREQQRTGIKSLKVRHNKVFGYYIEITKSNLDQVPQDYIRKQTLVNAERFITPELKDRENKILGAQDRAVQLEYELFIGLREMAVQQTESIQHTAEAIAQLDVLAALAERARVWHYVRPTMTDSSTLRVTEGRHPVIEQMLQTERFVPNDSLLDEQDNQLMLITGPNMAGKSTYIRQVAMIVIMAQMGSFVPAKEAEIGIVDRVFTRVGASDDIARGRSTFMVEMQETANILNNATPKSLIVLDEIGRGTSTFDGVSIAWSVAEYLNKKESVKAKTLFATHYHELTDLALTRPGIKNYTVLVREEKNRIAFLRKIVPGAADKSYGLHVARLAGLPEEVIERAQEILGNLEEGEFSEAGMPRLATSRRRKGKDNNSQLLLF